MIVSSLGVPDAIISTMQDTSMNIEVTQDIDYLVQLVHCPDNTFIEIKQVEPQKADPTEEIIAQLTITLDGGERLDTIDAGQDGAGTELTLCP